MFTREDLTKLCQFLTEEREVSVEIRENSEHIYILIDNALPILSNDIDENIDKTIDSMYKNFMHLLIEYDGGMDLPYFNLIFAKKLVTI